MNDWHDYNPDGMIGFAIRRRAELSQWASGKRDGIEPPGMAIRTVPALQRSGVLGYAAEDYLPIRTLAETGKEGR